MVSLSAMSARGSRKVIDHLCGVGATARGSAVSYIPTSEAERKALSRLQRKGVVSLADGGRRWIDEDKAWDLRSADRMRGAMIAGGLIAAAAAAFALAARTRSDRSGGRASSAARTG